MVNHMALHADAQKENMTRDMELGLQIASDGKSVVAADNVRFGDIVRDNRDKVLSLSARQRILVDRYTVLKAKAANRLGQIADQIPPHFRHLPDQTVMDLRNAFLVIDLEATRDRGNRLDREFKIRTMVYTTVDGDLYAASRDEPHADRLPVHVASIRSGEPDRRGMSHWDDLRRSGSYANAKLSPRDFLVLPLEGPIAEDPTMAKAARFARIIQEGGVDELNDLAALSLRIRSVAARIDGVTETVLGQAAAIAGNGQKPVYDHAKIDAVHSLGWQPVGDRYLDALTVRRPVSGRTAAMEALNGLPLAEAVLTYVAAKGRRSWTEILDLPDLHPDLRQSSTPAPSPRLEIRGSREIASDRAPGVTGTTTYEALQRGEAVVLSTAIRPAGETAFDTIKPGDVVRLHQSRRGETATGHLDVMVTGPLRRINDRQTRADLDSNARLEGLTPDAMKRRIARLGEVVQLPVRVLSSDAVVRPVSIIKQHNPAGYER